MQPYQEKPEKDSTDSTQIETDPTQEALRDGKKHRFVFSSRGLVIIQQNSFAASAQSHHEMVIEFGLRFGSKGGYLMVKDGNYVLLDEKSDTLPLPTLEEFTEALQRGTFLSDT